MQSFRGKVAMITGGSSGIGLGLARALAKEGAKVAVTGTSESKLDAALAALEEYGAKAIKLAFDVVDPQGWTTAVEQTEHSLGPIDLVCLNAGINSGRRPLEDFSLSEWRNLIEVNVNGVFNGLKACLPRLKARGAESHIVITASIGALIRRSMASPYDLSKTATLTIAEILRAELKGSPIGVSVLCPAGVRSDILATSRRHTPNSDEQTFAFMKPTIDSGMDPLEVGQFTLKGIREGRFYIFTHPGFKPMVEPRFEEILAGLADVHETGSTPQSATRS